MILSLDINYTCYLAVISALSENRCNLISIFVFIGIILFFHFFLSGQVHRAKLKGQEVVLKVQRPGLKDLFDIDLKNLRVSSISFLDHFLLIRLIPVTGRRFLKSFNMIMYYCPLVGLHKVQAQASLTSKLRLPNLTQSFLNLLNSVSFRLGCGLT